jgi:hypothetical protein
MDILHLYICIGKFGKGVTLFGSEGVLVNKWRLKQYTLYIHRKYTYMYMVGKYKIYLYQI